jgi:hypothetical protein
VSDYTLDVSPGDRVETTNQCPCCRVSGQVTAVDPLSPTSKRGRLVHFTDSLGEPDAEYERFLRKVAA